MCSSRLWSTKSHRLNLLQHNGQPIPRATNDQIRVDGVVKGGWQARFCLLLFVAASLSGADLDLSKLPPPVKRVVSFDNEVKPLLAAHCVQCHGPDKQKSGLRLDQREAALKGGETYAPDIRPGQSAQSPLIQFVAGLVQDMKMPAKGEPLTPEEIGLLRAWIDQGADWPEDTTQVHWSLRPVARPAVPALARKAQPIDAFILQKLSEKHLAPSPPADRRTLVRRVYFDLIGLPPSPDEAREFERDSRPDAWEKLVDRLLASPRYGERWGRHWLDVVRFAETSGFEVNTPRANAWPYRDYVIRSFNEDKPYNRFIIEQIAGDIFNEDAATGFLVAGPEDLVKSPDPVLTANQRADELHDMVSTTGTAFLGLTVGCARCHNHKFDPIRQTEYYSLKAIFEGIRHGERKLKSADSEKREEELAARRRRLEELDWKLGGFDPLAQVGTVNTNELRAAVNPRQNVERIAPVVARKLRFTIKASSTLEPCIDEIEVYTAEGTPRNIALASAGTKARASSVYPNSEIHRLEHINDGRHGNSRSWISNERGQGWVELEFPEAVAIDRIIWGRDCEQKFTDRLATDYRIEVATGSNDWRLVASSLDRLPYKPGGKEQVPTSYAGLNSQQAAEASKLAAERAEVQSGIAALSQGAMIYAGTFADSPGPTYLLHRGDPMQTRQVVAPGAVEAIPVTFDLKDSSREPIRGAPLTENQRRRLALAEWIANPTNPLTARVIVNRLWQYHLGEGLVSTPSDFGVNGARPTHPELLDWLAAELMQPSVDSHVHHPAAWSLKHIQRLIVLSATYRQASVARKECLEVDGGSRLLWRFPPRRLEAEAIRDTILSVSGKLDLRMGGPGFSFFEPNDNYVRVYTPKKEFGPDTFRRMVYGTVVRQRPDGVFGVFDCPDAGQIAPKRTRSTTPLQALNLLNSGFIMQQSKFLSERLENETGRDTRAQVRRAFALAFQREPDRDELAASTKLIREQGLAIFCRALFNANEFVYLF